MTIEQLLKMPVGSENRTGGFQLTLKRARKTKELDKGYLQEVVFVDQTGEIVGEVFLQKYIPLFSGQKIRVQVCWLQDGEKSKRLYVEQWWPVAISVDEYEAKKEQGKQITVDDEAIISMCRTSVTRHFINGYTSNHGDIPECTDSFKKVIDEWIKYILTGE